MLAARERYLGLLGAQRENYLSLNVPTFFLFVDLVWLDVVVEFFYLCLPLHTSGCLMLLALGVCWAAGYFFCVHATFTCMMYNDVLILKPPSIHLDGLYLRSKQEVVLTRTFPLTLIH